MKTTGEILDFAEQTVSEAEKFLRNWAEQAAKSPIVAIENAERAAERLEIARVFREVQKSAMAGVDPGIMADHFGSRARALAGDFPRSTDILARSRNHARAAALLLAVRFIETGEESL